MRRIWYTFQVYYTLCVFYFSSVIVTKHRKKRRANKWNENLWKVNNLRTVTKKKKNSHSFEMLVRECHHWNTPRTKLNNWLIKCKFMRCLADEIQPQVVHFRCWNFANISMMMWIFASLKKSFMPTTTSMRKEIERNLCHRINKMWLILKLK